RLHDLRLYKDRLTVPTRDADGKLWSLQFISADGAKRFLTGGRTAGCFHIIGVPQDDKMVIVCEGYATGASIHEATGHAVVVAFTSGNLKPVAAVWRRSCPTRSSSSPPTTTCGPTATPASPRRPRRPRPWAASSSCRSSTTSPPSRPISTTCT